MSIHEIDAKVSELRELRDMEAEVKSAITAIEDAAADAMVEALGDRWSYYIPANEYLAYREQMANAYVGI